MYALFLVGLMGDSYALPPNLPIPPVYSTPADPLPFLLRVRHVWEPVYEYALKETESLRTAVRFTPSGVGLCRDVYLGHGITASAMVESAGLVPRIAANLTWFPVEGIAIEMGFDLIQMRMIGALTYRP